MKIVQTFWSLPTVNNSNVNKSRPFGGWISNRYYLLSWAFSCKKWEQQYHNIILYTDKIGQELLVNKLQLPYKDVICVLDQLNYLDARLWALPKLFVYGLQETPFLHVDGDAYIWEKFDINGDRIPGLLCQNIEANQTYFVNILQRINSHFEYIPDVLKIGIDGGINTINAGILGGSDLAFIQAYSKYAIDFVNANYTCLKFIDCDMFNLVFEQLLFYRLAKKERKSISPLFKDLQSDFREIMRFNLVPILLKYIHLVGFAKQNIYACEQLELRMAFEFPDYYKCVIGGINEMLPSASKKIIDGNVSDIRINDTLPIFYNNDMESLLKLKIKLTDGYKIIKQTNSSEVSYYLNIGNDKAGQTGLELLTGMDELLANFEKPVSINELIEAIDNSSDVQRIGSDAVRFKLINFITEKMVIDGILQFDVSKSFTS